jgi:PAP2 superfamily
MGGRRAAAAIAVSLSVFAGGLGAQEPRATEPASTSATPAADSPVRKTLRVAEEEIRRYLTDGAAFVTAPIHWKEGDWERAAGVAAVIGGVMIFDKRLDHEAQERRSSLTDRVSGATTWVGGGYGFDLSLGLIAAGIAADDVDVREMGREAVETSVLTSLADKLVLKNVFGRERPGVSNGETVFRPGSGNDSFPSGHATQAFSIASVVAMRSRGWIVPTLAYTAATFVAFDRVNDRAHFPSDVVAGAALGLATGRFIVGRHERAAGEGRPQASFEVVPIRDGLSIDIRF